MMTNLLTSPYTYFSPFEALYSKAQEQCDKINQKPEAPRWLWTQDLLGRKMIVIDLCAMIENETTTRKVYIYCKKYWTYEEWKCITKAPDQTLEQAASSETIIPIKDRVLIERLILGLEAQLPDGIRWRPNKG